MCRDNDSSADSAPRATKTLPPSQLHSFASSPTPQPNLQSLPASLLHLRHTFYSFHKPFHPSSPLPPGSGLPSSNCAIPASRETEDSSPPLLLLVVPMDISDIASRLDLTNSNTLIRKAEELRRLSDVQFDSSIIGVGEVVKAIICLEIAASRLQVIFDRSAAIRMSGMSEKAYIRCFNAMQNGLGVKARLDIRELAVQFGCVRLISFVQKGFSLYKDRFLAALPASRRANTDFSRPVFTAVAFYLCAKKHKLKVDKFKLIELSGTSESEFLTIANSMNDLCFDVVGSSKEKKDPRAVKGHRELLDALPDKRTGQDDSDVSDDSSIDNEDDIELPCYKKRKQMEKKEYNEWKSSIISSNNKSKKAPAKSLKQTQLNLLRKLQSQVE